MASIKLSEYGHLLSEKEYIIDKSTGKVDQFYYKGYDKNSKLYANNVEIYTEHTSDKVGNYYISSVKAAIVDQETKTPEDKKYIFIETSIGLLDNYLDIFEKHLNDDVSLPVKIYRYDNTNGKKTEDTYSVKINRENIDIIISNIAKNMIVRVTSRRAELVLDGKVTTLYTFNRKGYRIIEFDADYRVSCVTNIVITSPGEYRCVDLTDFEEVPWLLRNSPSISLRPNTIYNDGIIVRKITYDNILVTNSYEYIGDQLHTLKEVITDIDYIKDENNNSGINLGVSTSIHPLYVDIFDSERVFDESVYCQDQIEYNCKDNPNCMKIIRHIYQIDKLSELKKDMKTIIDSTQYKHRIDKIKESKLK
jgi:hypothetical protein